MSRQEEFQIGHMAMRQRQIQIRKGYRIPKKIVIPNEGQVIRRPDSEKKEPEKKGK